MKTHVGVLACESLSRGRDCPGMDGQWRKKSKGLLRAGGVSGGSRGERMFLI